MTPKELTAQRNETHGSFIDNAMVSQALKQVIYQAPGYRNLSQVHREALDMICLKISRITTNDPYYQDHWDDIAGYAYLASQDTQ